MVEARLPEPGAASGPAGTMMICGQFFPNVQIETPTWWVRDPLVPVTVAPNMPDELALKVSTENALPPGLEIVTVEVLRDPVDPWSVVRVSEIVPVNGPSPVKYRRNFCCELIPASLSGFGVVMLKSGTETRTAAACAKTPLVPVTLAV